MVALFAVQRADASEAKATNCNRIGQVDHTLLLFADLGTVHM